MTADKDGGYAFACAGLSGYQTGMKLRDYYAGQAMAAILAHANITEVTGSGYDIAEIAYEMADKMLEARQPQEAAE